MSVGVLALTASLAMAQTQVDEPSTADAIPTKPDTKFIAVVIGLSSYEKLPDPVELDFARSDAAVVRKALDERAHFDRTFLLTDGEATREKIRDLLHAEVAQLVGPDDVFVLYFVGHGVGSDLDEPALLVFDSTVQAAQKDGFELQSFAQDLTTWTQAGTTLIVTDAIHRNQLDGIYFFGPSANQWPAMRTNTMVLSSSQTDSPAKDGAFGTVFADAIGGAADLNKDSSITAGELKRYLVDRVSPVGQIPVAAGSYSPGMVIAKGVSNQGSTDPSTTSAPIPDANALYPDTLVWSAKFVFREGASQTVTCRDQPIKSCSPSCYVRDFKAGVCEISAVIDGASIKGRSPVVFPGKYDCGMRYGLLTCRPPIEGAVQKE